MNATFLIIAGVLLAAVLVTVNTVLLSRDVGREAGGETAEAVREELSATAPDSAAPALAAPRLPEATEPVAAIALGSVSPDLARLRAVPGVRGVALWGSGGALLLAEGELMERLLPEASGLMKSVTAAASGLGSGRWASFAVEGVDGTIQGVRVGGLSLVVVSGDDADRREVERFLLEAAAAAPRQQQAQEE